MRFAPLILLLFVLAAFAYGYQERIAIIQTLDDADSIGIPELNYLTDRLRETAVNVLPKERYGVMTTESIVAFLGSQERAAKECRESTCLADLGRKVSADYVAQGRIGRFEENLTIKVELYNSKSGNLIGSFTGDSKSLQGLRVIIDEKAPDLFKKMLVETKAKPEPVIEVEKPELVKMEPAPAKPEAEMPKNEKSFFRTSFWVALGLDLLGAALIFAGYDANTSAEYAYESYINTRPNEYGFNSDAWNDVETFSRERNIYYIIGGVFLASGIGVHIWF